MEDVIVTITRGNVTEVKIVLTSIVTALAFYQVFLMAVGYGKLRLPFLGGRAASFTHRASGDTIVTLTMLIGLMCLGYFGIEDGLDDPQPGQTDLVAAHVVVSFALVGVLALKIAVLRWWHGLSKLLPLLGLSVLVLFVLTWVTSAGTYL